MCLATGTMALGALLWLVGNAGWLVGWPVPQVVPWWSGFLVLTIAGERLVEPFAAAICTAPRAVSAGSEYLAGWTPASCGRRCVWWTCHRAGDAGLAWWLFSMT